MNGTLAIALFSWLMFAAPLHAQSPCLDCLKTAREELKKCLDGAISQEDKKSCADKKEVLAKTCEEGECKIERAQSGPKDKAVPDMK
jgi:hypothetical protein